MTTMQLSNIELQFREGSSDKVYKAAIEETGGGFAVNFAYGRRGATLNTGSKTTQPVSYDEAVAIYDKLVKSKTAKGYKPVEGKGKDKGNIDNGIGSSITDREQRDTGLRAQLLNPITEDQSEAYLNDDNWGAQEKYDGKRMLLRKTGTKIIAANRNGLSIGFPDVLAKQLSLQAGNFIIDGESVGELLYVFDLLKLGALDFRQDPYRRRLEVLQAQFGRLGSNIIVAKTVEGRQKRSFLGELKAADREGIVFKDMRAPWSAGLSANAIKCKFWATCSCVVKKINSKRSVQLALEGVSVGNVTIPANHGIPAVGQIVEIRYLYVTGIGGSLYQPTYLGVRDDVAVDDCTVERQRLKYKPVDEQEEG